MSEEKARRETDYDALLIQALAHMSEGVAIVGAKDAVILYANERFEEMFGYPAGELKGKRADLLNAPQEGMGAEELHRRICDSLEKDGYWCGEILNRKKDGTPFWCRACVTSIRSDRYGTVWVGTHEDITEPKLLREELSETKAWMEHLLASSPAIIYSCRVDGGRFISTFVSRNISRLFGYEATDCLNDPVWWYDNIHPAERDAIATEMERVVLETEQARHAHEYRFRHRDGRYLWVRDEFNIFRDDAGVAEKIVGSWMDITDRKEMEEEIHRVQKLESIGLLAGGIAHDFNNLLTIILNNLTAMRDIPPYSSAFLPRLTDARLAVDKAKRVAHQLLTFSKGGAPVKKLVSLSKLIEENLSFFLRGTKVKLNLSIDEDLCNAVLDSGKIGQVFGNVTLNSLQVMPDGGELTVKAENVLLDGSAALSLPAGKYVRISIADEGGGMEETVRKRVFEPYFTTKTKGTGLGLSIAYSIIRQHDGHIAVKSRAGEGTTVIIHLPASDERSIPEEVTPPLAPKQNVRVLIMDDEVRLRGILKALLIRFGYEAEEAADGEEALRHYVAASESGAPFDVVVLDLTVPGGMGGKEAISQFLKIDRGVKAIVASGYCDDPVMSRFADYGFAGSLHKPYDVSELIDKINEILA